MNRCGVFYNPSPTIVGAPFTQGSRGYGRDWGEILSRGALQNDGGAVIVGFLLVLPDCRAALAMTNVPLDPVGGCSYQLALAMTGGGNEQRWIIGQV